MHTLYIRTQNPFLFSSVPGKEMVTMRKKENFFKKISCGHSLQSQQFCKLTLIFSAGGNNNEGIIGVLLLVAINS